MNIIKSDIVKSKDDLEKLKYFFLKILNGEDKLYKFLNEFYFEYVKKDSNNNPLTNIDSMNFDDKIFEIELYTYPSNVLVNSNDVYNYVTWVFYDKMVKLFKKLNADYLNDDLYIFNYVKLFTLLYEISRSYQPLIGNGSIEGPNKMVSSCYNLFYDFLNEENRYLPLHKEIKNDLIYASYKSKEDKLSPKLNSSIEASNATYLLAHYIGDIKIANFYEKLSMYYILLGYKDNKGSLIKTAKTIGKLNKLEGFEDLDKIPFIDRFKYGMPIYDEEKDKLINIINNLSTKNSENLKQKNLKYQR